MYVRDAKGARRSDGYLHKKGHEFVYSKRLSSTQIAALAFQAGYAAASRVPVIAKCCLALVFVCAL
jgi:hypothetical protein